MDDLDDTLLEGISGMWHYHISRRGLAICGERKVMTTHTPRTSWGFKPKHMPASYCDKCNQIRQASLEARGWQSTEGE